MFAFILYSQRKETGMLMVIPRPGGLFIHLVHRWSSSTSNDKGTNQGFRLAVLVLQLRDVPISICHCTSLLSLNKT